MFRVDSAGFQFSSQAQSDSIAENSLVPTISTANPTPLTCTSSVRLKQNALTDSGTPLLTALASHSLNSMLNESLR